MANVRSRSKSIAGHVVGACENMTYRVCAISEISGLDSAEVGHGIHCVKK